MLALHEAAFLVVHNYKITILRHRSYSQSTFVISVTCARNEFGILYVTREISKQDIYTCSITCLKIKAE